MRDIPVRKKHIRVGFKGLANSLDESVLDPAYAKSCDNFEFDKGVLTGGIGIDAASGFYAFPSVERHELPVFDEGTSIKKAFLYRRVSASGTQDDRMVVQLEDGTFYYTRIFVNDTWHNVESLVMAGDVDAVNYNYNGNDVLLLCSSFDGLYMIKDDVALVCGKTPKFTSIAVHNERVFGTVTGVNNQVWFSDDFDPANWDVSATEAGFINFCDDAGQALKVVSFAGYLFVFREYGVMRLTAYGDQSDFILKKVFTDTGRIYKDTIVPCGDRIIFLAEDGLFAFDGYGAVRIGKQLPTIKNKTGACAGYLDGKYFLACKVEKEDGTLCDALVKYDVVHDSPSILSGVKIRCICPVKVHNGSCVTLVFSDDNGNRLGQVSDSGAVFSTPTRKIYKSPENILDTPYIKTVRSVSFVSKYPVTLRLIVDKERFDFDVQGREDMQTVACEKGGGVVGIEIETECEKAYVSPLYVTLDVQRGQK